MFALCGMTFAQDGAKFSVELSSDSVLFGNYIEVRFTLENASGSNFSPPEFEHFFVIGGPNQSSSFSMINGEVTQSKSYTYFVESKAEGAFFIEPASIEADGAVLETLPIEVNILPNPDGVKEDPSKSRSNDAFDFFREMEPTPAPKPKKEEQKKRKTFKI